MTSINPKDGIKRGGKTPSKEQMKQLENKQLYGKHSTYDYPKHKWPKYPY